MPSAAANDFDFLLGTWHVRNRRLREWLVGSNQWDEFPARLEGGTKLLNDRAIMERFIADRSGETFEGVSLRIFDPSSEQWTIYWMDTNNPVPTEQVIGSFSDGVGEFHGTDMFRGKPVRLRFIWSGITRSAARWEQAYYDEKRGLWETNWIMDFTRIDR